MEVSIALEAPAKVNLGLRIVGEGVEDLQDMEAEYGRVVAALESLSQGSRS